MEKSRKPKIRFKGYNDDWEQRKLGELASSFEYGLNAASKSYDGINKYIRITDIDDETRTFLDTDLTSPDCDLSLSENYLLKDGDILFARTGASVGKTFIYKAFNGVVYYAGFLIRARLKENCSPQFVFYNTLTKEYEKFIRVTSQRSGQPGVNAHEYATFELLLPKYDEQCEIGKFFTNLDYLITLHQRKLDKLINVKKSMLEKMFPKQGSTVPEIRFNGFTHDWEQRELWELTIWDKKFNEVEAEKQPKIIKYPYVLADVFSKIEDASGDVRLLSTGNYIGYTTDEKAGKNLCVGEVVAIPWGGVPNIKYYKGKFVTADNRIATSNDTETLGNRFLSLYLEHSLAFLQSIYRGASIKHPSMNDVLSMQISIPHIQEQREIETWFANLDNLITLHQRKLEKLKNIKKSMLEKMFI